ncbi:MAG: iron ABC transporter permease [Burkholderiales bacterium]|nr:iron ABC transporter permease [Burkholderiales bacterium]
MRAALVAWTGVGLAAFVLLPWYLAGDKSLLDSMRAVFSADDSASGLREAARLGKPWLWTALVALALCAAAGAVRGPRRGVLAGAGAAIGLVGILAGGFSIGATGWSFAWMNAAFGALAAGQQGIGLGGALTLLALLMLLGCGLAATGKFRGDAFVAGSVVLCAALLLLFVALPVAVALSGAFLDDAGRFSLAAVAERLGHERTWGLGCLAGGVRCGVAWNTLFLALLTAVGTTVLGTMLALVAERGPRRLKSPVNLLSLLPIITPPFVVGLGLILLFGRAGIVNQILEAAFGVTPTRWFYGLPGLWLAQLFAFTPIACLIMRGVVAGISPSLEEAAQTLRADRWTTFRTVTLPLLKPGLANAFLVGFIESIADFGNPIVVGGPYSVLSTEVFFAIVGAQFDQGRAASLALILSAFALAVFLLQQKVIGRASYTTVSGKGDAGVPMRLPSGLSGAMLAIVLPWLAFTIVVYLFAFAGGFVATWGRDYTPTLRHFVTAFDVQWANANVGGGLVWAGTAWNSLFTTLKLAALAAPLCALLGLLISWLLARTRFRGQATFEFGALLAFAIPGTVLGVSYVLVFNVPPFELTGTALIIVLCFVFRSLPVGVRAGAAAFKQIDRSLDEASTMLHARTATTLRRIVLPLLKPALVAALVYSFVRSMTTVSAVIFLVTAENELATTYIIGRVGNGDYGVALAYCTVLILLMSLAVAAIQWLVGERRLGRRHAGAL